MQTIECRVSNTYCQTKQYVLMTPFLLLSHFGTFNQGTSKQTGKKMCICAVKTIGWLIHDLHARNKVAVWLHYCQTCTFLLKTSIWTLSLSKDTDESNWFDVISVIFIKMSAFCSIHLMLTINWFLSVFWNVEWSPSNLFTKTDIWCFLKCPSVIGNLSSI